MTKNKLQTQAVPLAQVFSDFTDEEKKMAEAYKRYFNVLISIKKMRKKLGLTQEELAEKAKIPRTTVTKIESGSYNPTISTLMSIASAMDKKLQVIFN